MGKARWCPRYHRKVLGIIWLGKMHVVPEAVFEKIQAYPTPKNVKEMQAFVGFGGSVKDPVEKMK